ncbi:hypothetical protein CS022_02370 [Veronia nyctiphanis]|uniref:Methyltransferase type 11 domain-containing protein n=1 Tax=Veronia nyctiphanis TaxID=1278244 RepID=A0A4Q0YTB7_9GAMM|nr:hypothetical protein [Veronia nyctiphanis]RXJ74460.1 hypothetical protein CS022_02370 [Veronia nyctiphanis]
MDDFYLDEKGLGGYFEAEWLDKLKALNVAKPLDCRMKDVPEDFAVSTSTSVVANFIERNLQDAGVAPQTALEVGPALGRNCYELIQRFPSVEYATLVEPSFRLLSNLKKILIDGDGCNFSYIHAYKNIKEFYFSTRDFSDACEHVTFNCLNSTFDSETVSDTFDVTMCMNVLDQCESPNEIVLGLKEATNKGGVLFLSCTYQWKKYHFDDESVPLNDINDYFGDGWEKLDESDYEYKIRFNERFSRLFMTHIVAYRKK